MKGIPIKFRGTTIKYKEVVYGDLFHCDGKTFIMTLAIHNIAGAFETQSDEVAPDSVAQLVGYDANGEEIYEGDEIQGKSKTTYTVLEMVRLIRQDNNWKFIVVDLNQYVLKKGTEK